MNKYYCKYCNYQASSNYRLESHCDTSKHLNNKKNANLLAKLFNNWKVLFRIWKSKIPF